VVNQASLTSPWGKVAATTSDHASTATIQVRAILISPGLVQMGGRYRKAIVTSSYLVAEDAKNLIVHPPTSPPMATLTLGEVRLDSFLGLAHRTRTKRGNQHAQRDES
jgi:hypothetical protein